jgi:uncharacterized protein YjdB
MSIFYIRSFYAPFNVSATGGGSGNSVTFTSQDPTIATCSGTNGETITIIKAGTVKIIFQCTKTRS